MGSGFFHCTGSSSVCGLFVLSAFAKEKCKMCCNTYVVIFFVSQILNIVHYGHEFVSSFSAFFCNLYLMTVLLMKNIYSNWKWNIFESEKSVDFN